MCSSDLLPRPRIGESAAPITVALVAGDPLTGQGVRAHLRTRPDIRVLGADRQNEAQVIVVLVDRITQDTLKLMERIAVESTNQDPRFVVVGDGAQEYQVVRAVCCGLVSIIPRREADFGRILRAVFDIRNGRLDLPGAALGWLAGRLRAVQRDVLVPNGLTSGGLEIREADVLGMLAEGLSTAEIAERLNYSERTVKYIIHGILIRLNLRNRTQAVAFAMRAGLI